MYLKLTIQKVTLLAYVSVPLGFDPLKAEAELYVPDGKLISYRGPSPQLFNTDNNQLTIDGLVMTGSTISGCKIGILLDETNIAIGVNR